MESCAATVEIVKEFSASMLQWEDCCEDSGDLFKANRTRSHISFLFLSHMQETTDL